MIEHAKTWEQFKKDYAQLQIIANLAESLLYDLPDSERKRAKAIELGNALREYEES